ncbi:meiosis regulator and mRNA stability factor 1 isoform X2 [Brienomyrus brachyistius]|uniref:meiosis regulator and mRNA stability factor 1 isoform X2 n=1 Tax=Brienomyrus brachyistius TaxID=42636 RepID=UPI0020B3993A|nr:meiosis regulator and mRNA stability factor 1 isoform X2 [Brienomyrus brachyistius]
MESLGKESSFCSSRPFKWLNSGNEAPSRLWNLSNCFSSFEQTTPLKDKQKVYMENRKPVLELKDVPPPPHHNSSKTLHAASLPPPRPCLPPQESLQQQPAGGPKVSTCSHCDSGLRLGSDIRHSGGALGCVGVGGGVGGPSHLIGKAEDAGARTSCPVGPPLRHPYPRATDACTQAHPPEGCELPLPLVATSQPLASRQHLPCCTGLLQPLHPYSTFPLGCGQPKLLPSAPVNSAPLHGSCVASSGYYVECGLGTRGDQHFPTHGDISTSTHLCTNPLHLNVEHTICLKGAHYCGECLSKSAMSIAKDTKKTWPHVPPPPAKSAPVPVPMCNGCGVTGTSADSFLLVGTSLGKSGQRHGSPESGLQENLPPVGVFWDIENCSVPSGRSAVAVVQRIRTCFFLGHREAEFICVCDISKESKEVIQELNNCQVTVAHINATAKNAADDKLRQSLRRFADTHTAPATVVLVSSDVNFGSELSDLRHRHGFRVILVHKNQASEALLQHAHQHVAFEDLVADLPSRVPLKPQPCFTLLYVSNLPTNRDGKSLANRLRRLSDNCGGKVLSISAGCAVLRFGSREAAERASKRMENEDVFGSRISVSLCPRAEEASGPPPAVFVPVEKPRSPRRLGRITRLCQGPPELSGASRKDLCRTEPKPKVFHLEKKNRGDSVSPLNNNNVPIQLSSKLGERSRRRHSMCDSPVDRSGAEFQVSTPSAFSKLSLQKTFSPLILSQGSWSSRSASPCLSSRSSPLTVPSCSPHPDASPEPFSDGVDILVANVDYRMSRKELQQALHSSFSKYGRVRSVELSPHTDYQLRATVQMRSLQQAVTAVSNLHRHKIGTKRVHVSLLTGTSSRSLAPLSSEIISILHDSPACCLPLFKLTEIYEKKFSRKLAVSDLYKLTEVLAVRDQGGSRLVCLLPSGQARQSPLGSSQSHDGSSASGSPVVFEELEYHEPVCRQHHSQRVFSESDFDPDSYKIPFVMLSLKPFAAQVHSLLQTHEGTVPLLSFPECYAAEFCPIALGEGELEGGVPLEHLITCIPGVNIVTAQNGFKVVKWIHNKPPPPNAEPWVQRCKSPVGNPQLIQFSREVVDLIKNQPHCIMPVSKFIPSYHHHFGKQCRVSDYGYSKLLELLEAVPHVLQILGMGSKRLLTLTHRAQVKRFTQDLLKLLKFQVSKQVIIRDFMQAYHWCFSRDWSVLEYGMCDLMDLLSEIPDTTITITQQDADTIISIPKRERTPEEVERTKQFAKEVVDLLRHQPHCRMPFSKFIPSYHHHFGRQCKLSYYGFTKLIELFEAIPDVLLVLECGGEKILSLTEMEKLKALAAQFVKLLRSQKDSRLPLSELLTEYSKTFGYGLRLQDFDVGAVPGLLQKLCHVVKMVDGVRGREVQLISRKSLRSLTTQLLSLLMSLPAEQDSLTVEELSRQYEATHGTPLNPCEYGFVSLGELLKSLPYLVELFEAEDGASKERVRLTPLYQFARSVRALLHTYHYNQIFLTEFLGAFSKYTGKGLLPDSYGYSTVDELLGAIPQVVWIKGHGHKKIIVLKNDMKVRSSPITTESSQKEGESSQAKGSAGNPELQSSASNTVEKELLCLSSGSPVDLLCGPVPSCLPSPQLHPDPVLLQQTDLIRFEEHPALNLVNMEEPDLNPAAPDVYESSAVVQDDQPQKPGAASPRSKPRGPKPCMSESPKRASRNKVKLAANFSVTPVTRL